MHVKCADFYVHNLQNMNSNKFYDLPHTMVHALRYYIHILDLHMDMGFHKQLLPNTENNMILINLFLLEEIHLRLVSWKNRPLGSEMTLHGESAPGYIVQVSHFLNGWQFWHHIIIPSICQKRSADEKSKISSYDYWYLSLEYLKILSLWKL